MKKKIVIFGSGAIGRGFLPWVISLTDYEFVFVDINEELVNRLNQRKKYATYRVKLNKLEELIVPVEKAYLPPDFSLLRHRNIAAVFMSVGPRNCALAARSLRGVKCPIILCENDSNSIAVVKSVLNYNKIYFAIPDVIASSTAPPEILAKDSLSVVVEDGTLFVDQRAGEIKGKIKFCDEEELKRQWIAKSYLHNTPHCIAAYLGALVGLSYLHEAMGIAEFRKIVKGAMSESLRFLKLKGEVPYNFLKRYGDREIKRFSRQLLYDPISRVAREPLRKLELNGRLLGVAQDCLSAGFVPQNILIGIIGALLFENEQDHDHQLSFLRKALPLDLLLTYVLGLRRGEALGMVIRDRFDKTVLDLKDLVKKLKRNLYEYE